MSNDNKAILWEEFNWKDIEKLTTRMKMVIIPIGSCEQHGPHLPLGTDTIMKLQRESLQKQEYP